MFRWDRSHLKLCFVLTSDRSHVRQMCCCFFYELARCRLFRCYPCRLKWQQTRLMYPTRIGKDSPTQSDSASTSSDGSSISNTQARDEVAYACIAMLLSLWLTCVPVRYLTRRGLDRAWTGPGLVWPGHAWMYVRMTKPKPELI